MNFYAEFHGLLGLIPIAAFSTRVYKIVYRFTVLYYSFTGLYCDSQRLFSGTFQPKMNTLKV